MIKLAPYFIALTILFSSCVHIDNSFNSLPEGMWQAILHLDGKINELVPYERQNYKHQDVFKYKAGKYDLPFLFEVKHINSDSINIIIHNGEEQIILDQISFGTVRSTAKDTFRINFPLYGSYISAVYEDGILEGNWHVPHKGNYKIPFVARFGRNERFTIVNPTTELDLTGQWKVRFGLDDEDESNVYPALGEFVQKDHKITGTFMTETGDYRFLEGIVYGNEMVMSCFDGAHAFLFRSKIYGDGSLRGVFKSGIHYTTKWDAHRDENYTLSDPDSLTQLVSNAEPINFAFLKLDGDTLFSDEIKAQNKPMIIQIMGTWCPNCKDESQFLKKYIAENDVKDLQFMAVAYERPKNSTEALEHLTKYKKQLGLPYPIVLGGIASKDEALNDFPQLNKVISFPTMLFIDRVGNIQHIHTGFAGPATSEFENFKTAFDDKIKIMISQ